ncbi:SAM-dependent methyltransferase [Trebonia kvetii]|uniref:SAM-dependent methyltransferase n=1 Tax=Trebonia kvetii TaxID=2480626 RepID=UPI001FE9FBB7|nr:methyltransferase domain-containing protein [Trebonia kvetii]
MDLPRHYTIRESSHRIHNPLTSDKLAALGEALNPPPGTRMLDLACGTGEMLCTWAREHQVTGTGVDISTVFIARARDRAAELGVDGRVSFVHGDASGYVAGTPAGIAACVGATWIGGGVPGTVQLLRRSLQPGGVMLIGEPYWRLEPPDQATVEGCHAIGSDQFLPLPELIERFGDLGCDVVEMVLASQDSWDSTGRTTAGRTRHRARAIRQVPARISRLGCVRPNEPLTSATPWPGLPRLGESQRLRGEGGELQGLPQRLAGLGRLFGQAGDPGRLASGV